MNHILLTALQKSYHQYLTLNTQIYIACSGGRDSMALLFACHQLNLPIHVLHINHKLQAISDDWQIMVENFCQNYQIPYQTFVLSWQNPSVVNEAQARTARYQAIADFVPANAIIATAHHANDQAETLLMNLCKGTGLTGLIGMSEFSVQHEFDKPLRLWRPLLTVTRDEINEFVNFHQIPYVDDPTNETGDNQRAFLREQILPKLNARFGNVVQNINRSQTNLTQAKTIIDEQVQNDWQACHILTNATQSQLTVDKLKALSKARRFELLHAWVKGDEKFAPNRQLIEQIDALVFSENSEQQTILHWQDLQIRRYRTVLYRLAKQYFEQATVSLNDMQPFGVRDVSPNENFQRLDKPFHEPFKKICQRLAIPSWERVLAKVLINDHQQPIALILPNRLIWLASSASLTALHKQQIDEKFTLLWQHSPH